MLRGHLSGSAGASVLPGPPLHVPAACAAPARLTIGVLLDHRSQERWVLEALRQVLCIPGLEVVAVAIIGPLPTPPAACLHGLIDRFDHWLRCRDEPLFARVDVAAALHCAAPLHVPVRCEDAGWLPREEGCATLRGAQADIWLCFTAVAPRAPFPQICRHGVWGLEIGLRLPAANRWAGATEVRSGSAVTMAQLVDYARPGFNALYRACGATVRNSARRNRLATLRKAMSFFRRQLAQQVQGDDRSALPAVRAQLPAAYPLCEAPTLTATAQLSWRLLSHVAANRMNALGWRDQWRIGYYFAEPGADALQRPARLRSLVPPEDCDWADPFLVEQDGRRFLFFEELPLATGKGHIAALEIEANGEPGMVRRVLERPYHLSYPFLFRWDGELYMLPETAGNGTVEVYRCVEFPARWVLHKVLFEGIRAVDATLLREADRWWLFVNVAEPGADPSEELHLYWSDAPFGPWQPHPANPVVSDARRARGAGPLFRRDGVLYRPSQDCSITYGHSVSINRVDVLDTRHYEETPVGRIGPEWNPEMRCLHTYGELGSLRVVDFRVRRPKWRRDAGPSA